MATSAKVWPGGLPAATSTLTTSLFDFDSSLPKYVKAVMIDADQPTDTQIDIAYFTNTIPYTSTTSLVTAATAGVEYTLGVSVRSIGFVLTLKSLTQTNIPKLKRLYVRAAPVLQSFRRAEYMLDLSGRNGEQMLKLRDSTKHTKDGMQMAQDLNTAAAATTPFSITDRFGTFTGVIEPDQMEIREVRPEEFAARVVVRQV